MTAYNNHNADILNNSVKLGINIYNEFNNMYSFNKSLTHHSNTIYFQASNLVNIILIHKVKGKVDKHCNTIIKTQTLLI